MSNKESPQSFLPHLNPQVALRWFCSRSLLRQDGITKELIDRIPGRQTERKTPLGELNWIFTAITDTIAWNMLPKALFQKLFRSVSLSSIGDRGNSYAPTRVLAPSGLKPTVMLLPHSVAPDPLLLRTFWSLRSSATSC